MVLSAVGKRKADEKLRETNTALQNSLLAMGLRAFIVNLNLHKNEICYSQQGAQLYSLQKVITGRGHWQSIGVPLGRGFRTNFGTYTPAQSATEFRLDSPGQLYITNQRIIFISNQSTTIMKIEDIVKYESFLDGVKFYTAKKVYLFITGDCRSATIYGMVLNHL